MGLEPSLKTVVYDSNFWPKGVAFARFDFKRGQQFLDNPRNLQNRKSDITSQQDDDDFLSPIKNSSP